MGQSAETTQTMTSAGLNLIKQALSIYDSDLKLVVANARFREMFDIPPHLCQPGADFAETIEFLVEKGEYGVVNEADKAQFIAERVERALDFQPHYFERQRADGRWVSVEGSPLPEGGWVAVYTDITPIKRQEDLLHSRSEVLSDQILKYAEDLSEANRALEHTVAALEEAKRQLTESEARTRLTTEMMPAHIAHVGPDRRYTYSNRRLSAVMPGRPKNIIGQHIKAALGDSAYGAIRANLEDAFNGHPSVFEFNDRDSSRRIRVAFTPDGETGDARGVYILSMDVTEETQARAALQQTRRRELAAQMTSGLAHDFSNLLTIILGMQSRLERMSLKTEPAQLVEATISAARRGGTLLHRIADMTGQRAPKLAPCDIGAFLDDLNTLATPSLPAGVALHIQNDIPDAAFLVDTGMLQDSLLNLILNARDAVGETGAITLEAAVVQDTWLEFVVTDTGDGFSDEALSRALDPFFTTKGAEGSGLGLAMVYDTTKLMGGEVRLSNTGRGARVSLRLPLRRARADAAPGLALLVEDDPDLRGVIRDMLTQLGHTVIEAASVEEARVLLQQVPEITLVLSDISLEGTATGVDLIRDLPVRDLPAFLMTSLPQTDPLYVQGATLAPILQKPFTSGALAGFLQTQVSP